MSQVRYTIGTISSNRTQFNTAIIWLIRVQLSVILPGFDLSLSEKKAEMCFNMMIFFTLVISRPNINCQMIFRSNKFKTYSQIQPKLQNFENVSENTKEMNNRNRLASLSIPPPWPLQTKLQQAGCMQS